MSVASAEVRLELEDIQGLAVFGYHLPHFCFQFLHISSPEAGRSWINQVVDRVTTAVRQNDKPHPCLNVGFTSAGLAQLGLSPDHLAAFEPAFRDGIESRSHVLGDRDGSHPDKWEAPLGTRDVHALLMLFASTPEELDDVVREQKQVLDATDGVDVRLEQRAAAFPEPDEAREHFGFRDGISRVTLIGSGTEAFPGQPVVEPGEFVLGYPDAAKKEPRLAHPELLCNGTFLVYRKLEQDVVGFRRWVAERAAALNMDPELFKAKLVGRWPSGAPLVRAPAKDDPELGVDKMRNADFDYSGDPKGLACPIGSHVRRANPRDMLGEAERKRHLLMRRGLPYGSLLPPSAPPDGQPRGMAGVFVNASISRQFEFVQQHWLNDRKRAGLTINDTDPICGDSDGTAEFTIPRKLFAKKARGLPRFTTVRGGGYFFAPGIGGLRFLASQQAPGQARNLHRNLHRKGHEMAESVAPVVEPLEDSKFPNDIHNYITSIADVIPERLDQLKMVLGILTDPNRESPIPKIGTIHFARWALIDDETRLLFTTNFDGPWDVYLERFVELGSRSLDAIWGNTKGYPERGSEDIQAFKDFVRRTSFRNSAVYCAYPEATVREVQSGLRARRKFREFLGEFEDM